MARWRAQENTDPQKRQLLLVGVGAKEVVKCQGFYSSSDDRTSLTYRCTIHTAYIGPKVGGTGIWYGRT